MSRSATEDERLLIARSQRGDVQAFNQLVLRYQQLMYSAVFRMLGNAEVAADVTQEAFLSAFRAISTFRPGSSFRAWLLRIGSNLACDHWRRVQRHPTTSLDELTEEDAPHAPEQLGSLITSRQEENPEAHVLSRELQELIQQGLAQLPLDQRVAVILCDIQGLSYDEIAEATQATLGTVRSRIARGRSKLRSYLSQHRELLPGTYRLSNE